MLTKKALGLMIGALLSGALIGGEAAAGQTLADFHSKMGGCASCHGTNAVTTASVPDDERALNAQCQTCHGSYKDIRKTGTEIDPHHSHLGDINCTSCHTAHARPPEARLQRLPHLPQQDAVRRCARSHAEGRTRRGRHRGRDEGRAARIL